MSDYISEDTVALILRFLPVESLLRFRCVCRGWKQLIDSPLFMEEHLSLQKPGFLANHGDHYFAIDSHALPSIDTLDLLDNEFSLVVGTHHGVVCLHDCESNFMLWNPSIHKFSDVLVKDKEEADEADEEEEEEEEAMAGLVAPGTRWDTWECIALEYGCYGFWIDPWSKEFKIIVLNWMDDEDAPNGLPTLVGILYSSIRSYWRVIQTKQLGIQMAPRGQSPVMIQGVAYWKQQDYYGAGTVVSFDFILERFDIIELPQHLYCSSMQHWKGSLSLVQRESEFPDRFSVYVMQEGLWVSMFHFNLISPSPKSQVYWLFGEVERVRALVLADSKLVVYDTRSGIVPLKHEFLSGVRLSYGALIISDFVESLLFPYNV